MARLKRLLHPHPAAAAVLIAAAAAMLIYVFVRGMEDSLLAYIAYPLSAYALAVAVAAAAPVLCRAAKRRSGRTQPAWDMRARRSLRLGLCVNIGYALIKCGAGWHFRSAWFGAVGTYYLLLSMIRFLLVHSDMALRRMESPEQRHRRAWRSYRACGYLVLLLNIVLSAVVGHTIHDNRAFAYPGVLIYAMAAYTFYRLGMAIYSTVRCRRAEDPVLSAAKCIDMCVSLMSLYALQSAMIATFGSSDSFRLIMNSITGTAVCLWMVFIGAYMLLQAHKKGGAQ